MSSSHPINYHVLQVRHLPKTFSDDQSTHLLKMNGAHTVTFKKSSAFAFFGDEVVCRQALHALHQLQLNDSVLLVTFARSDDKAIPLMPPVLPQRHPSRTEEMIRKIHAVAPKLGLNYILNPMVKYKYPPINDSTLANICEALRENSNFYTQVLHLMNKMSIPPPFRRKACPSKVFQRPHKEAFTQMTSESDSDLSDTENICRSKKPRRRGPSPPANRKPVRKPKTDIPVCNLLPETIPIDVRECFEIIRKIPKFEIASVSSIVHQNVEQMPAYSEGFGRIDPPAPEPEETLEMRRKFDFDAGDFADLEKMERLSIEESIDHPAFRNYEEGDSCVRLYVKNLHKSTTVNDLFRIFGQFVPFEEAETAIFDIRLMKSGRMRGQAFVTFATVRVALKALEAANRMILNGKPMSVQFARAAPIESQEDL